MADYQHETQCYSLFVCLFWLNILFSTSSSKYLLPLAELQIMLSVSYMCKDLDMFTFFQQLPQLPES